MKNKSLLGKILVVVFLFTCAYVQFGTVFATDYRTLYPGDYCYVSPTMGVPGQGYIKLVVPTAGTYVIQTCEMMEEYTYDTTLTLYAEPDDVEYGIAFNDDANEYTKLSRIEQYLEAGDYYVYVDFDTDYRYSPDCILEFYNND